LSFGFWNLEFWGGADIAGLVPSSYYQRGIDSKEEGGLDYMINILKHTNTINQRQDCGRIQVVTI
jgi:hypothetical protein